MAPRKGDSAPREKQEARGSTSGFRSYPTDRDILLKSSHKWIEGKRSDDGAGAYWRVHDKLYDLTDFIQKHPGGRDWLLATRGTDITEVFESSHLTTLPHTLLPKYFVRNAHTPRNSPYTFHQDGFFKTFRRKVGPVLRRVGRGPTWGMVLIQDTLAVVFASSMLAAAVSDFVSLAVVAGIFLSLTGNCSHNFVHQRDSWRMYYFDLTFLSSYEFRISHVLSHHAYPNTIYDYEISVLEPFWEFLPKPSKNLLQRYGCYVLDPLLLPFALYFEATKRLWLTLSGEISLRPENLLPILELVLMALVAPSPAKALRLWLVMHSVCSTLVVGLALVGTHHHPDIYHEGDAMREDRDFGLCQLDAVRDRAEVNVNLLLVAISYGHHTLHHLLPTLDHSKLEHLYPAFLDTCRQFKVHFSFVSVWYMTRGKYRQLANVTPSLTPNTIS
ncbi:cytochrome b5-related protein-like [Panulirus ornatus]|uniref:cytochrome b5-related protein-like n=1 Tax=Panulirus ornatus TaxID=150431 RepID=UPI003A8BA833